ncbi:UPF0764 protein C16orf89 homolog [Watersipora subatra]|uniref:UPF0764 protein C16orf89 homolog n=1 Tax=Watersipora subatra TaxID=2589382 RepID=UPI00355C98E6
MPWKFTFLLLILSAMLISAASFLETTNQEQPNTLRKRIASAIKSATEYMRANYDHLNLDAVIGLRIVQAQLEQLRAEDKTRETVELLSLVSETIEVAIPEVASYEHVYYEKLRRLIAVDFWPSVIERDGPELRAKEGEFMNGVLDLFTFPDLGDAPDDTEDVPSELFDEDSSDMCIEEALRSSCNISSSCLQMMMAPDVRGYSATHQLYYFLILSQSTCVTTSGRFGIIADLKKELCSTIYMETKSEPVQTDIEQDLFMEQVAFCGLAGYFRQFSRIDWVERILGWQRPAGCYGQANSFLQELRLLNDRERFRRETKVRAKREERLMPQECLCHRTTVALMALVQNYRAQIQPSDL